MRGFTPHYLLLINGVPHGNLYCRSDNTDIDLSWFVSFGIMGNTFIIVFIYFMHNQYISW